MKTVATAVLLSCAFPIAAQPTPPQRSLDQLIRRHEQALVDAQRAEAPQKAMEQAFAEFIAALQEFLRDEAKGPARVRTRLTLVGIQEAAGRSSAAVATLRAFEPATAGALECAHAAIWASRLGLAEERQAWIDAALAKPASLAERMELGTMMVTALGEVGRGQKIFTDALARANSDEERATVLWHTAAATREREDLPEGAYDQALEDLVARFPKTRYGQISKDRLAAMQFAIGRPALPFAVELVSGTEWRLDAHEGDVVLLCFFDTTDPTAAASGKALASLRQAYGEQGLQVLALALDADVRRARENLASFGLTEAAAVIGGWQSDLALRYMVEASPHCLLIGRKNRLLGMNYLLGDSESMQALRRAIEAALGKGSEDRGAGEGEGEGAGDGERDRTQRRR